MISENIKEVDLSECKKLDSFFFFGCEVLKTLDLSNCTELTECSNYLNSCKNCFNAEVRLPESIKGIEAGAFGGYSIFFDETLSTNTDEAYCKRLLVPNEKIKQLLIDSGYPPLRIEMYAKG